MDFFNAFVIIEGGAREGNARKPHRDKFAYLAWGNAEKGSKGYMETMVACAKDARLESVTHEMEGIGHAYPETEKILVKKWIEEVVIPGLGTAKK